jgi:hypothetical protein
MGRKSQIRVMFDEMQKKISSIEVIIASQAASLEKNSRSQRICASAGVPFHLPTKV